eukprot:COSAG05_NODE_60_length_23142_cov_25.372130_26_plen_93_part_00
MYMMYSHQINCNVLYGSGPYSMPYNRHGQATYTPMLASRSPHFATHVNGDIYRHQYQIIHSPPPNWSPCMSNRLLRYYRALVCAREVPWDTL